MARRSWKTKGVNSAPSCQNTVSKYFSLFVLFKSSPFRCVSVGPPVYSWGRIWPIGGKFSISYFKSSIQISVINLLLSFDIILFLRGTRYGPIGVRLHSPIYISYILPPGVLHVCILKYIWTWNLYLQIKSWSLVEQDMTLMGCNVYLFFLYSYYP